MRATSILMAAVVAFAATSSLLAPSRSAFACSCVSTPGPADLSSSDVVFSGTVLTLGPGFESGSSAAPREVSFAVDHVWVGNVPARATVLTASAGASCGYERFVEGERFIVYARSRGAAFETNLCQPTRPYDESSVAALEKVAGPGFAVVPTESDGAVAAGASDETTWIWWISAATAAVTVFGLAAGLWKHRRDNR